MRQLILPMTILLSLTGCQLKTWNLSSKQPEPTRASSSTNEEISRLKEQIRLKDEKIKELSLRADRLAEKVRKLEFLNEQLQKQLEAVGDAPKQRDRYKQMLINKELEIKRLEDKIKKLQQEITRLKTSGQSQGKNNRIK
ncbi:MAG: hypothetical protein J7L99_03320 [Planctomycetes bacterium]|nr:hypothetical protein [Planctomycetota bacterium]